MLEEFKKGNCRFPLHVRAVACVLVEDLIAKERLKNRGRKKMKKQGGKKNEKTNSFIYIGRVNF
jgi:hypothetical protein